MLLLQDSYHSMNTQHAHLGLYKLHYTEAFVVSDTVGH